MSYLLDTCIISKLRKISKYPDPLLQQWASNHSQSQFFLSTITLGEIQQGISQLENPIEARILENWLLAEIQPHFKERILPIDADVAIKWGELQGIYSKKGKKPPAIDSLLAATAIVHNLILVTANIKDFSPISELKLFSPWEKI